MPSALADAVYGRNDLDGNITTQHSKGRMQLWSSLPLSGKPNDVGASKRLQQVQSAPGLVKVQHIPQLYNWDCGIACVLMVIRALGCSSCDFQQLKRLSQTTSVWTVDLAHLLAHFGASVTFTTTTIGINHDYADEWFYMEHIEHDERRVQQLFQQAEQLGISIQQRSLSLADLAAAVTTGKQMAILLVDRRKIDPWQAAADLAWNYTTGVTSATPYTGHYILVVGYEPPAAAAQSSKASTSTGSREHAATSSSSSSSNCSASSRATSADQQVAEGLQTAAAAEQPKQQFPQQLQQYPQQQHGSDAPETSTVQSQSGEDNCRQYGAESGPAFDALCAKGGFFWVHDPARSRGPVRVPVNVVESARKTFGTDEDILLVDIKPLNSSSNFIVTSLATSCQGAVPAEGFQRGSAL